MDSSPVVVVVAVSVLALLLPALPTPPPGDPLGRTNLTSRPQYYYSNLLT